MQAADILILSNGPGEVTTWVRPVVKALRQQLGNDRSLIRISVVLSPCPNAMGKEAAIAQSYPEVDRVQSSEHFFPFLLWGKTAENWDWREKGVVVFLGGDQFFPLVLGKRLGYRTVVYAEWEARWHSLIDRFGVMQPQIIAKAPKKYAHKLIVVGDLMADVGDFSELGSGGAGVQGSGGADGYSPIFDSPGSMVQSETELIGLLPGSKPAKLAQGVPLGVAIAEYIHQVRPQTRFVIPVAPTLDCSSLACFANSQHNPLIQQLGYPEAELITPENNKVQDTANLPSQIPILDSIGRPILKTSSGVSIELYQDFPAYDLLRCCQLCLTTVGANTAELGSLAIPMIVLLPTQQLDAMRSWDGLGGILARLPGIGSTVAKVINGFILRQGRLFAWPNIWAKKEIVPELVGKLQPQDIAQQVIDYLEHPEKLEEMRSRLRQVRGKPGAAQKLAEIVREELDLSSGVETE